jgi:hypothetical protein
MVATALLSVLSILLEPAFPDTAAERLAAIEEGGTGAAISAMAFTLAQLPFIIAVVAIAAMVAPRAPRLAWIGGVLAVLGGFGHAVFGGVALTQLALATDTTYRAAMAEVVDRVESGPAVSFMAMGLLGTVLGLLFLSIGLFRTRVVPRWVPAALWAFLVVEFVGTGLTAWATPAAGVLYLAALSGTALALLGRVRAPASAPKETVGA